MALEVIAPKTTAIRARTPRNASTHERAHARRRLVAEGPGTGQADGIHPDVRHGQAAQGPPEDRRRRRGLLLVAAVVSGVAGPAEAAAEGDRRHEDEGSDGGSAVHGVVHGNVPVLEDPHRQHHEEDGQDGASPSLELVDELVAQEADQPLRGRAR